MANRMFNQYQGTLERGVVTLFARISFGASGAPTLQKMTAAETYATAPTGGWGGIKSITRNSAGDYTLLTQDKFTRYLFMGFQFIISTGIPAGPLVAVKSWNATTPTINFLCTDADTPAATDPDSGSVMVIQLVCQNSVGIPA